MELTVTNVLVLVTPQVGLGNVEAMKRSTLAIAATLGLAASLISSPAHAQPNLPESVIECVARELGPAAAQQIQTQRANAEQEAVIRQCFQSTGNAGGNGGGGQSGGP
jgi:hypothetical protein